MRIDCGDFEIRDWLASDEQAIVRHANNANIAANLRDRFPHPYRVEDAREFLRSSDRKDFRTSFAIVVNGEACGGIGVVLGEDIHFRTAELGYWLGESHWNRGIMSRAVAAFCDWAFKQYKLDRIYAQTFVRNAASSRVLEKAGFQLEGIMRDSAVKNGELLDQAMYALLRRKR